MSSGTWWECSGGVIGVTGSMVAKTTCRTSQLLVHVYQLPVHMLIRMFIYIPGPVLDLNKSQVDLHLAIPPSIIWSTLSLRSNQSRAHLDKQAFILTPKGNLEWEIFLPACFVNVDGNQSTRKNGEHVQTPPRKAGAREWNPPPPHCEVDVLTSRPP